MKSKRVGKAVAEVAVELTPEQKLAMSSVIERWRDGKGLVVGSLADQGESIFITFRLLPRELGETIIEMVENNYAEEKSGERK